MPSSDLRVLCRIDSAGISLLVFSGARVMYRDYQNFPQTSVDERHLYERMAHQARIMLYRMTVEAHRTIRAVPVSCAVVVGEPWSHMISRRVEYSRKTSFRLTQAFVKGIVDRDMKRALAEYQQHRHDAHTEFSEPRYHHLSIAGHVVPMPWKKMVNNFRLEYSTGWYDRAMTEMATEVIHQYMKVPLRTITLHHAQSCIAAWWGNHGMENALLINPSGRVTELYIFQANRMTQWGTVPMGIPDFERALLASLKMNQSQLPALLSLNRDKLLGHKVEQTMEKSFGKSLAIWRQDVDTFCRFAIERGMVIEQIVWLGQTDHPALQYLMRSVSMDNLSFPVVFGSSNVGSVTFNTIMPNVRPEPGMLEDRLIAAGLE